MQKGLIRISIGKGMCRSAFCRNIIPSSIREVCSNKVSTKEEKPITEIETTNLQEPKKEVIPSQCFSVQ